MAAVISVAAKNQLSAMVVSSGNGHHRGWHPCKQASGQGKQEAWEQEGEKGQAEEACTTMPRRYITGLQVSDRPLMAISSSH